MIAGETWAARAEWVSVLVVVFATALTAGVPATVFAMAAGSQGYATLGLLSLGSTMLVLWALPAAVVSSRTLRGVGDARAASFARLLRVGVSPNTIGWSFLGATSAASLLGAVSAAVLSPTVAAAFVAFGIGGTSGLGGIPAELPAPAAAAAAAGALVLAALASIPAARRAAATDPLLPEARDGDATTPRGTLPWLRVLLALAVAAVVATMLESLRPGRTSGDAVLLAGPLLIVALATAGGSVLGPLSRLLTSWLPRRPLVMLARGSASASWRRNDPALSMGVLAIGLPSAFDAGVRLSTTTNSASVALLVGAPAALAVVSLATGYASAVAARADERATAHLLGFGSAATTIAAIAEAVILAATSAVAVLVCISVVTAVEVVRLEMPFHIDVGLPALCTLLLVTALVVAAVAGAAPRSSGPNRAGSGTLELPWEVSK